MRTLLALIICLPLVASAASYEKRSQDLIKKMTLEEKVELLGGNEFSTKANARLGIPELKMTDGPVGVRWGNSTSFPSGISMGASFNPALVEKVAAAMGAETRAKGRDMLLGPCVGISRVPFGGRNFESMGEDPFLTASLTTSYVHGLNSQRVVGSVKHFGLNDQEYERMTINSVADERTMHEIHFVAFEAAVNAGVGSVMASYNKLNGTYASENSYLLTDVLKKQFGFKGFVVSDWDATHSTVPAALAGLDLEMPRGEHFNDELVKAVRNGEVPESLIDDKVRRIFKPMFEIGLFDGADKNRPDPAVINSREHQDLALEMARESHVLLQNKNGFLPLQVNNIKKIAVIGPNGEVLRTGGGGSSYVDPFYSVSVVEGLRNRLGGAAQVVSSMGVPVADNPVGAAYLTPSNGNGPGLYAEYFDNKDLQGEPVLKRVDPWVEFYFEDKQIPGPGVPAQFSVRWSGTITAPYSGQYDFAVSSDDGVRVWLDDVPMVDRWNDHGWETDHFKRTLVGGRAYKIRIEYYQNSGMGVLRLGWTLPRQPVLEEALRVAGQVDAVVIAAGFNSWTEGEAQDRSGFSLPAGQDKLIREVAGINPNTIVVINSGNPVAMGSWLNKVPAVIYAWFPGQEGGNALADILLGRYNPSGRLPVTMLKRWEDSPAFGTYPEINDEVIYKEGIYVGYRHFDRAKVEPQFPFGFGLSYTKFAYSDLKIEAVNSSASAPEFNVSATITNAGPVAGHEVVQLYMHDEEPKTDRPVQELKGFSKVFLQPGQSQKVQFKLSHRSFAYYDVLSHGWKALPGRFEVRLGSSSRDIRLNGDVILKDSSSVF